MKDLTGHDSLDCPFCLNELRLTDNGECRLCKEIIVGNQRLM